MNWIESRIVIELCAVVCKWVKCEWVWHLWKNVFVNIWALSQKSQCIEQCTLNSEHVELVLLWLCHHWWHERRLFALRVVCVPQPQPQVSSIFLREKHSLILFSALLLKLPFLMPIQLYGNSAEIKFFVFILQSILQSLTFPVFQQNNIHFNSICTSNQNYFIW